MQRTIFYIDGFNLYYSLLKKENPDCKWLNLRLLAENILGAGHNLQRVNYYTARVSARTNPASPKNQQIYFNALKTEALLNIHLGRFLVKEKYACMCSQNTAGRRPNFLPIPQQTLLQPWPNVVRIVYTEEKQSDVNLAAHLLRDAFTDQFDCAAILTNDTDLAEPMRIVLEEVGKNICLLCPALKLAGDLDFSAHANFSAHIIKRQDLLAAQFPDILPRSGKADIVKPQNWL